MVSGARYVYSSPWFGPTSSGSWCRSSSSGSPCSVQRTISSRTSGWAGFSTSSPILLLIVAALARVGARLLWWSAALLVVQFIQPILATLRDDQPVVAAFHPVLALVIFWLAFTIGLKAWHLAREPAPVVA